MLIWIYWFISWAQVLNNDVIKHYLIEIRSEPASYSEVELFTIISFAHKSISFSFALGQCYTSFQQLQSWLFTWCAAKALVWNNTKACAAQVTWGMSDLSLTFPHRKVTCSIFVWCALCRNKVWTWLKWFKIEYVRKRHFRHRQGYCFDGVSLVSVWKVQRDSAMCKYCAMPCSFPVRPFQ